jgi:alpha-methylacyl-CoA racemase
VAASNPSVVYCSVTGFGHEGPRSSWAGHDINYVAIGGFLAAAGRRADGVAPLPGSTVADAAAGGMHAALAICTALVGRGATGVGTHLEVSAVDGVVWLCSLMIDEYLATGTQAHPGHGLLTGRYACYDTYLAGDGGALSVGAIEHRFFDNLCRALGCEQWSPHQFDDDAQPAIRRYFTETFATKSRDEWAAELADAETCVAPVRTIAEVATDPNTPVVEADHPVEGRVRQLGAVLAGMPALSEPVALPTPAATDTQALLAAAGVDPATVARWFETQAVA